MSIYGVLEKLNPQFLQGTTLTEVQKIKFKEDKFTVADYDENVFFAIFPEFIKIFDKENNKFNFMFAFYLDIALGLFNVEEYDRQSILCISLYLAHNLELALNRSKNINNEISLNSTNTSETLNRDKGGTKKINLAQFESQYRLTSYGMMLYPLMQTIGKIRKLGVY